MQGVLLSEVTRIRAQISNPEVHQPQGRHDAWPEGGSLPLAIHCYAMKESWPPQSADSWPAWRSTQGVLPSKVAKIQAQINNLEVHQPQGRHDDDAWLELEVSIILLVVECKKTDRISSGTDDFHT
ncbi:hypothetical protein THAOC_10553 [Thalassiosira oceanica]|uniref:Uncharacterized protein n=1 Tax=Thalassiosira oceanica TaxID=159749 RepID=K0TCR9_THAOC|nr:hypothetical protein THAOC_10553 [Thalassiosira oceanica]|eukprot:EJK68282.1 hypothetical protein THAOC_10553 [Thalassiosira oceanica]